MTTAAEILAQSRIGQRATRARRAKPDGGLVQTILEGLLARKIWARRLNSGAIVIPADEARGHRERVFRATFEGCPDIVALVPGVGTVWIEAKTPTGKLRVKQVEFRNECLRTGSVHVVARRWEDVEPFLVARGAR